MNEREIFAAALQKPTEADRRAFLDDVCDADMRQRIEQLLNEQAHLGSFLEHPPVEVAGDAGESKIDATILGGPTSENPEDQNEGMPFGYLQPTNRTDSLGRLGHYEILELIGTGAFGTVLKAFDEKLQRVVAIKVLAPEMAATSPARKRFLREARSSAQVRHENVVSIYAVEDEPIPYLVMEYIPGRTLQQRLDEHGPLDLPNVLRLGKQIADGLAAAHDQQLIHRDVKPGNILLDTAVNDHVKITDFGLARTVDDATMTQSGMIAGTPLYMAPEQALGAKLDQRADLFSLGSVLYQMLSGRPPFRAPSTVAVLKRVAEENPRPIQEIIPEVPDWMCRIIGHLHAKDPDDRYRSAKEVSDLLAECLADVEQGRKTKNVAPMKHTSASAEQPFEKVRPRDDKRITNQPYLKVAAAVVLFLLLGLGITEATGVTKLASTVIRLTTGSGTLVIETDDPDVKISIDGEEVTIRGGGVQELTLRPGEYKVAATKDGKPMKQELVSITRNGHAVFRMTLERAIPATVGGTETDETASVAASTGNRFALAFDGDNDYVETPIRVDGSTSLTLEATVQLNEWPSKGSSEIVSNTNKGGVSLAASNRGFKFAVHNGDDYVHVEAPHDDRYLNRPVKLAGVLSSTKTIRLFVDGKLIDEKPLSSFHSSGEAFSIGTSPGYGKPNDGHQLEWTGQILEVRISNYPWYIKDYDATKPLKPSTRALALYRFDEGGGNTLNDSSGKENHGKIVGAKWVGAVVSVDEQMAEVRNELKRRNPGFDASTFEYRVEKGVVVHVGFLSDHVTDLSPLQNLTNLRSLDCSGSWADRFYGKDGLSQFADLSPLRGLSLNRLDCNGTEVADLSPLQGMPLEHLSLAVTPVADLSAIDVQRLTYLNIGRTQVSDAALAHFEGCKNLTSLILPFNQVTDAGVANFHQCNELTTLGLYGTQVSDTGLALFQDCRNLTTLHLGRTEVTDEGLAYFKGCRNLTALNLGRTKVSDSGLAHFRDRKSWTALDLSGTNVSDKGLALYFWDLQNLTHLDLSHTEVSDAGLAHFQDCNLTVLVLNDTKVGDVGLAHFNNCKNLTWLGLQKTRVTNEGLAQFKNCKNLSELQLSWTKVGDAGLAHFKNCKNLTYLALTKWPHSHGEEQVTDVGLAHFKDSENLETFILGHTHVSDAGLAHLQNCRNLTTLALGGTKVSDLSLLKGMSLKSLSCDFQPDRDSDILRSIESLEKINGKPAAEFWNDFEAHRRFASGELIDVISLIDPQIDAKKRSEWKFAGKNEWRKQDGELCTGYADKKAHKIIFPLDSDWTFYEYELNVTRQTGERGFVINIPTERRDCPLIFGSQGVAVGSGSNTQRVSEEFQMETGKPITLHVKVDRRQALNHITVSLDGETVGDWNGNCTELALSGNEGYAQDRRSSLFLFDGGSEFVFHKIRLRMLDGGTATTLRPGPSVPGKTIDLIPLIDGDQKKIRKENGLLVLRDEPFSNLVAPVSYEPVPREYDLHLEVERREGRFSLGIGIPYGGQEGMVVIDGWGSKFSGLEVIDGEAGNKNPTTVQGAFLPKGVRVPIVVAVRRGSIRLQVGEREIFSWAGRPEQLRLSEAWPNGTDSFFLGAQASEFAIHKFTLTPYVPSPSGNTTGKPGSVPQSAIAPLNADKAK